MEILRIYPWSKSKEALLTQVCEFSRIPTFVGFRPKILIDQHPSPHTANIYFINIFVLISIHCVNLFHSYPRYILNSHISSMFSGIFVLFLNLSINPKIFSLILIFWLLNSTSGADQAFHPREIGPTLQKRNCVSVLNALKVWIRRHGLLEIRVRFV